jgi:uncharacterized integral membrane protein
VIGKSLKVLLLVPLTIVIVLLAVANRQAVTVSIDPFSSDAPAFAATAPLFAVVLVAVIVGALVGGVAAWLGQAKWRRTARRQAVDLKSAHAELEALRRPPHQANPVATPLSRLRRYLRAPAA